MAGRMPGGMDGVEVFVFCEEAGFGEWAIAGVELEESGREIFGIEFWQGEEGVFPFLFVEKNGDVWELLETTDVVEVEMGEDDGGGGKVFGGELERETFFGFYFEFELGANVSVDEGATGFEITGVHDGGVEAGVDQEGAFGVFDNGHADGEPFGEGGIEDGVQDREFVMETGGSK